MTQHLVTSHGADFFGQDTHQLKAVRDLADYARGVLSYDARKPLAPLIQHLETAGTEGELTIPADQAAPFSELLSTVAGHRHTKPKPAKVARLLGDAAARAAAEGEPWTWTTTTAE
ncbi:hypothetical protein [Streptomyces sp. NPDC058677]|uniref:DUF7739 domain-containing protein n=1 Tax=Streptomyces sp. NPDC058677 TaxID=3346594 RepID=UPI0036533293